MDCVFRPVVSEKCSDYDMSVSDAVLLEGLKTTDIQQVFGRYTHGFLQVLWIF